MTLQSEGRTIKPSNVHQMYITCTSNVHHMHITCTSHVHHIYITCTSHAHHMYITCTSHVHQMYTVHHMYIKCTSHVHQMYTHACTHTRTHTHTHTHTHRLRRKLQSVEIKLRQIKESTVTDTYCHLNLRPVLGSLGMYMLNVCEYLCSLHRRCNPTN